MYKLLLANRYLRTRFIALASIISVTLGVATMIVVNSVMAGFSGQMKDRIHGILADVMIETTSTDGTAQPEALMKEIERIVGPYVEAMTPTVEVYGMMSFDWAGQTIYRPVTLIGIVPESKNAVSPLSQYLLTRQEVVENGETIRTQQRSLDEKLDWELSELDLGTRKKWMEWQQFKQRFRAEYGTDEASAGEATEPNSPAAPPIDSSDPFAAHMDGPAGSEVASSEPMAELDDPFSQAPVAPDQVEDPSTPQPARVYVGAGLISFPYQDRETGKTRTMYMVNPGQDVNFTTIKTGRPEPAPFRATVVDVFKSGMSEYDSNLVFVNLEQLQFARGMLTGPDPTHPDRDLDWRSGEITTLQLRLKDYEEAPEVVRRLRAELPAGHFQVRTWEQKQGPLLEAVEVESAILNVLLFLIIAVAGFGILAIFYMIVVEKTRDIGIMKALGASSRGIMSIFVSYGLCLGLVGSGAGVILGLLFVYYINQIEALLSSVMGRKVFDEAIYYFHEIPTAVHPSMVAWVAIGAVSIAVLASVLPARRAARLHPVQALRYE